MKRSIACAEQPSRQATQPPNACELDSPVVSLDLLTTQMPSRVRPHLLEAGHGVGAQRVGPLRAYENQVAPENAAGC